MGAGKTFFQGLGWNCSRGIMFKSKITFGLWAGIAALLMLTGCRCCSDGQKFVLEDGTILVAGGNISSRATAEFKRLYAAYHDNATVETNGDAQAYLLSLAKMLCDVDIDDPVVQEAIGDMYLFGRGMEWSVPNAICWYKKAAAKNRAWAQFELGWIYWNGFHIPQDKVEAVRWFRKAADNGSLDASRYLGEEYSEGKDDLSIDRCATTS